MSLTITAPSDTVVLTSPKDISWGADRGQQNVSFKGKFYAASAAAAHQLRRDLIAIVDDLQAVTISYSGESGVNGSYWINRVTINSVKTGPGLYEYTINAVVV